MSLEGFWGEPIGHVYRGDRAVGTPPSDDVFDIR